MNRIAPLLFCLAILLCAVAAQAEPYDTHHRIHLAIGAHSFFPDDEEIDGTRPNEDGVVTDAEFEYIWDVGYDMEDFNSGTFELGYEYMFKHWFGLGFDLGWYGNTQGYNFVIENIRAETELTVAVFHLDIDPRFHWQARWTDLYGGPVVGLYRGGVQLKVDINAANFNDTLKESADDSALGWGAHLGFEFRVFRYLGFAIEDRLMSAVLVTEEWKAWNGGGNVISLQTIAHF